MIQNRFLQPARLLRFSTLCLSRNIPLANDRTSIDAHKENGAKSIKSDRSIKVGSALQKLTDRFMISATFPDTFLQNLSEFDKFEAKIYAGFDPTSNSLHIGNLLTLNGLLHLFDAGLEIFIVVGGATGKLGDPSGKKNDRSAIDWPTIQNNSEEIATQIRTLFENYTKYFAKGVLCQLDSGKLANGRVSPSCRLEGGCKIVGAIRRNGWGRGDKKRLKPVRFLNNAKWYADLNVIDFLDSHGRQFRVKHLLEKQAIRSRLTGSGMNLNEFLYQIFQAYDFLKIFDDYGCLLQFGGSDQVGNVHAGHDLIKKMRDKNACGIFAPLLTHSDGEKLGKSLGNSVCLNPKVTSPFEFYQYFVRLHDDVMQKFLYLLTFIPVHEIDRLHAQHMKQPEMRLAQKTLAENVTLLVHGQNGLDSALHTTQVLFSDKIEKLLEMSPDQIDSSFRGIPTVRLTFRIDFNALELVLATKYFEGEQEAEFWLRRGSVYINGIQVKEPQCVLVRDCHVLSNGLSLVKFGKKKDCFLIRWSGM